jgi:hypothetical protein
MSERKKPKIITLCGSIRFENEFRVVNSELTLRGWVVLAPGCFNHSLLHEPKYNAELTKDGLDQLHVAKMEMSDAIFVVDVLGYQGESTAREVSWAYDHAKTVYKWSKGDLWKL